MMKNLSFGEERFFFDFEKNPDMVRCIEQFSENIDLYLCSHFVELVRNYIKLVII